MTPAGIVAIAGVLVSLGALWRRPHRPARSVALCALAVASWSVLWFAAASPFAHAGMSSLPLHMVSHILVMFMVPMGLIYSGVARSWWWLVPVARRRRILRWWYVSRRWHLPRALTHPLLAALVMNGVMVTSHTPRVFDAIMERPWAMNWIMEPAFLFSGLFFFHFIVSSPPRANHVRVRFQLVMVLATMVEMVILAMSMAIFTTHSWYSVMDPIAGMPAMPGMGMHAATLLQAFHDQQLAAAILWICGDFWAVPAMVVIIRRVIVREGSLFGALDRTSARYLSHVA